MLDMAILGLLEEHDLHGYEIRRQLREHLGLLANVSFGSIYPALTRLEKSGAVVATVPIGTGTDAAQFDPKRKRAFSSNGDGTLTVVSEDSPSKFSVAETVQRQLAAGVDVVNDGEASKPSYATYVQERLSGFGGDSVPLRQRDFDARPGGEHGGRVPRSRGGRPVRRTGGHCRRNSDDRQWRHVEGC